MNKHACGSPRYTKNQPICKKQEKNENSTTWVKVNKPYQNDNFAPKRSSTFIWICFTYTSKYMLLLSFSFSALPPRRSSIKAHVGLDEKPPAALRQEGLSREDMNPALSTQPGGNPWKQNHNTTQTTSIPQYVECFAPVSDPSGSGSQFYQYDGDRTCRIKLQ